MGELVVVYGASGVGKSTSLRNFGEKDILLINVDGKRLPFKKKFAYVLTTEDVDTMINQMIKMPCKVAVIDDAGMIMANRWCRAHSSQKVGNASFQMYNDLGDSIFNLMMAVKKLPPDVIVYMMFHEEQTDFGSYKIKTIGKMVDSKCPIESHVTICLRAMIQDKEHVFITQNLGTDVSKSPINMFPESIPNDLMAVDKAIREYYGMDPIAEVHDGKDV